MLTSAVVYAKPMPLTAARAMRSSLALGWMLITGRERETKHREFDPLVAGRRSGLTHVRIRVAGAPTEARFIHLRKLVEPANTMASYPLLPVR